jgi:hypothetical protein
LQVQRSSPLLGLSCINHSCQPDRSRIHSWDSKCLLRRCHSCALPLVVHRLRAQPWTTLDPVGSISLAYCYVLMTLLQFVSAYRSTLLYRPPINSNSNALPLSALSTVLRCRPLPIHRVQRYSSWLVIFKLEPPSLRAHKQCDGTARHHPVGSCCQRAQWFSAAALRFIVSHRGPLVFRTPASSTPL